MATPLTRPLAELVDDGPKSPAMLAHELFRLLERVIGEEVPIDFATKAPVPLWAKLGDVLTRLERLEGATAEETAGAANVVGDVSRADAAAWDEHRVSVVTSAIGYALHGNDGRDVHLVNGEVPTVVVTDEEAAEARRLAIAAICALDALSVIHVRRVGVEGHGPAVVVSGVTYGPVIEERRLLHEAFETIRKLLAYDSDNDFGVLEIAARSLAARILDHLDPF